MLVANRTIHQTTVGLIGFLHLSFSPLLLAAPPLAPAAPRVESHFEHFCNQAKITSSGYSIAPDTATSNVNQDGDELPGYSCVEKIYALGGQPFKMIFERLGTPCLQTWTFKGEGPGGTDATSDIHMVNWTHRVSIETPQGARRVVFSCYSRPLPVGLRVPKGGKEWGLHATYSKAVYGQDGKPFEGDSQEAFKLRRNLDPLFQVYRGSFITSDRENYPKRPSESSFGPFLESYKLLGLLRDKPIVFSRKLTLLGTQWDVKTTREVSPGASLEDFVQALGEQARTLPVMRASYPCSEGLSLYDYIAKYKVTCPGADFREKPKVKPLRTLDFDISQPLLPWDEVYAAEHSDGVPFIACYDVDPLASSLCFYVLQYEDEAFPRVAFVHQNIMGLLSRSLGSMEWFSFSPEVLRAAQEAGKNIPKQAYICTSVLAALEHHPELKDKALTPLGNTFEQCLENLEISGIRSPETKEETVLFPSANAVYR